MEAMTQRMTWLGFVSTVVIIAALTMAAVYEPTRQENAAEVLRETAIVQAMDLYALNCAECHGSQGQGDIEPDATTLSDEYMRSQEEDWLFKAIARGRDNTEMAAFALDEGGALTAHQVTTLVTMIKHGSWDRTAHRVAELGMIPPAEQAMIDAADATEDATEDTVTAPLPDESLPVIEVVPTVGPDLPNIAVVPTVGPDLPNIAIVPTVGPDLPNIAVVPTAPPLPMIDVQPTEVSSE